MIATGETLVAGTAEGEVLALAEPLSFWGGFDAASGCVIDRRHPDRGRCLTGRIVLMSAARGSSSGASVLAEAIRSGTAPAGFVVAERDAILAVGAMVAAELYARHCPIVVVTPAELDSLKAAARLRIEATTKTASIAPAPESGR